MTQTLTRYTFTIIQSFHQQALTIQSAGHKNHTSIKKSLTKHARGDIYIQVKEDTHNNAENGHAHILQ